MRHRRDRERREHYRGDDHRQRQIRHATTLGLPNTGCKQCVCAKEDRADRAESNTDNVQVIGGLRDKCNANERGNGP